MKDDAVERIDTACYQAGQCLYLPAYAEPGMFYGPGRIKASKGRLQQAGAQPVTLALWPRYYLR